MRSVEHVDGVVGVVIASVAHVIIIGVVIVNVVVKAGGMGI